MAKALTDEQLYSLIMPLGEVDRVLRWHCLPNCLQLRLATKSEDMRTGSDYFLYLTEGLGGIGVRTRSDRPQPWMREMTVRRVPGPDGRDELARLASLDGPNWYATIFGKDRAAVAWIFVSVVRMRSAGLFRSPREVIHNKQDGNPFSFFTVAELSNAGALVAFYSPP